MNILRKISRGFAATIFRVGLVVLAFSLALVATLGNPDPVKTSLGQSGVYSVAVEGVLEMSARESENSEEGDSLPLTDPAVQEAAQAAFNPGFLEQSANQAIDGIYVWLDGGTAQPEFVIDLSGAKTTFIEQIADYAENRVADLRPCTDAETQKILSEDIDPLTVQCRPPIVLSDIKKQVVEELSNSEGFLDEPIITGDTLFKENKQPAEDIPRAFGLINTVPTIAGIAVIAAIVSLILLHNDRRRGIWQASVIVLSTGIFIFISALILEYMFGRLDQGSLVDVDNSELQAALINSVTTLFSYFTRRLLYVSAAFIMVGAAGLGVLWLIRKRQEPTEEDKKSPEHKPHEAEKSAEEPKQASHAAPEVNESPDRSETTP